VTSHPRTLLKTIRRTLVDNKVHDRKILVALSGGPDSTALVHALSLLRAGLGLEIAAFGVNHGLRPEARAELDKARESCKVFGVPFSQTTVKIEGDSAIQEKARDLRYAALRAEKERLGYDLIATAHHADDRAETVLFRLLRGGKPPALSVLPELKNGLLRPMVRATKADVLLHLSRWEIEFSTDPSNLTDKYARNKLRHDLIPHLLEYSPNLVKHLNDLADWSEQNTSRPESGLWSVVKPKQTRK
jgi:tRNA(Ile)-lysidine synthase